MAVMATVQVAVCRGCGWFWANDEQWVTGPLTTIWYSAAMLVTMHQPCCRPALLTGGRPLPRRRSATQANTPPLSSGRWRCEP